MKRAFSTVAFASYDYEDIISAAKRNGIDGVEIRLDAANNLFGHPAEDTEMIGNAFREAGVAIADIGTSVCIKDYNENQVKTYCKCLDTAKKIGARGSRMFLANFCGRISTQNYYDYDGIVKAIKECCIYGKRIGQEVWVETHNEFSEGRVLKKLWDDVGEDNLYFIWDLIHPLERGESAKETVSYIGKQIAHVHIKDGRRKADRNDGNYIYTKLGEGDVPVAEMIKCLKEIGYDGYLSLEWEAAWRAEIKTVYTDPDKLLCNFNEYLDGIEKNLLPLVSSDAWYTYEPEVKTGLAEFSRGEFDLSLDISLNSNTYGVGKWVCDIPVKQGFYKLTVACESKSPVNDLYVLTTTVKKDGSWDIREHAENCESRSGRHFFSTIVEVREECDKLKLELWLKGRCASVRWFAPTLVPCEKPAPRVVRVANAFLDRIPGRTLEINYQRILATIDRAAKVNPDVILLSECMYHFGTPTNGIVAGMDMKSPLILDIQERAKRYKSYICFNFSERDNGEYFNTSVLFDRNGNVAGKQRKTHITDTEADRGMSPGRGYQVIDTDFGKVGIMICWDHYFSVPTEEMVKKGAEIVLISTIGDAAEKSLARAMDSGLYHCICGHHVENDHGWGPSRIIAPNGKILGHSDDENEVVYADIDLNEKVRQYWLSVGPAWSNVRTTYKYERNYLD